jgi:cysteine-rich repeat protein
MRGETTMSATIGRIGLALSLCILVTAVGCGDDDGSGNNNNSGVYCGDGVVEPPEACDGADVGGETCEGLGYHGGVVGCAEDCTLDVTLCEVGGWCGDGHIQEPFEQCDGTDIVLRSCALLDPAYDAGEVFCTATCTLDLDNCSVCGDGDVEGDEPCDDANVVRWDGCDVCETVEFLVHPTDATSVGEMPRVAVSSNGSMVAVYSRYRGTGGDFTAQIMAQLYAPSGVPSGPPVAVTSPDAYYGYASVAMDDLGRFVIVYWDPVALSLVAQQYDAVGQVAGTALVVDSAVAGGYWSSVSMAGDGTFAVAWDSKDVSAPDRRDVFARVYDAAGTPVIGIFQMNANTANNHEMPKVALSDTGEMLAVWSSSDATSAEVTLRRFDSQGVPESAEVRVSGGEAELRSFLPSLSLASDGGAVVVWLSSQEVEGGVKSIMAQRISPAGALDGSPVVVVESTMEMFIFPGVVVQDDGRFLVAWGGAGGNSDGHTFPMGVGAREFDAQGAPLGDRYVLNHRSHTLGYTVALAGHSGRFAAIWIRLNTITERGLVYAQRFAGFGQPVGLGPW